MGWFDRILTLVEYLEKQLDRVNGVTLMLNEWNDWWQQYNIEGGLTAETFDFNEEGWILADKITTVISADPSTHNIANTLTHNLTVY
jgi:hypothetical protein